MIPCLFLGNRRVIIVMCHDQGNAKTAVLMYSSILTLLLALIRGLSEEQPYLI